MHFEGSFWPLAPRKSVIFLRNVYNEHLGVFCSKHVPDDTPLGALQFTSDEVESVLQDFEVKKGSSPDGIPPIILKNCASAFAKPTFSSF
jgi:hypothetical protein